VSETVANDAIDWSIVDAIGPSSDYRSLTGRSMLEGAKTRRADSLDLELALRDQFFAEWGAIV